MAHTPKVTRKWESIPFLVWLAIVVAAVIVFLWLRLRTVKEEDTVEKPEEVVPQHVQEAQERVFISPRPTPSPSVQPAAHPTPLQNPSVEKQENQSQSQIVVVPEKEEPEEEPAPEDKGLVRGLVDRLL